MLIRRLRAVLAVLAATAGTAAACAVPARADTVRDGQEWVLRMLDVAPAWRITEGAGVLVAVIDSGVDGAVSDLSGQVIRGPDFTGVRTRPGNPDWGVHGTWMASLIAGHGHDGGSGVIGIAPRSRVLAIRVIPDRDDPHYGDYERQPEAVLQASLAAGIGYAVRHGAQVISMSIGYASASTVVRAALLNAVRHGVVVVASAGNSGVGHGGEAPDSFPAEYPGVIGVGAVNAAGAVAGFSSDNLSVQVVAPGVNVPAQGRGNQYWYVSGTSPACALVAGVAALIKSRYPGLSGYLVARALTASASMRPANGYDPQVGFGIVDAAAALATAARLAVLARAAGLAVLPAGAGDGVVVAGHGGGAVVPGAGGGAVVAGHGGGAVVTAAEHFGGGPAANPAPPVRPRGTSQLVLFAILALTSLTLIAATATRLATLRR